jgi:hypothetical protein
VDVPPLQFLMLDGQGDPNSSQEYQDAIEALYAVAYALKFMSKKELGKDFTVMPLEGLWEDVVMVAELAAVATVDEWVKRFAASKKDEWAWTMMILQPAWITEPMFEQARAKVEKSKGLRSLPLLRMEMVHEGLAVQTMHIGPYADEGPTLARLHLEYIPQEGYAEAGKHHEIYLSDPRRSAPEKLKTVLRQPVKQISVSG